VQPSFLEIKVWKEIPGFNGYLASDDGCIGHKNKNGIYVKKQFISETGYPKVTLYVEGRVKNLYVHRLVAFAFIPNPENRNQVNHIDGNKLNPRVDNLEWNTASENMIHAFHILNRKCSGFQNSKKRTGINNHRSKKVSQLDKSSGAIIGQFYCAADIQRKYGFDNSKISACCRGVRKSAYGFCWRFADESQ
jgi:hypothetical protein